MTEPNLKTNPLTKVKSVRFLKLGGLGIAVLNRPQALNALNLEMFQALRGQIHDWINDPTVAWIVIRGEGPKAFCAGGDVKGLGLELQRERAERGTSPVSSMIPGSAYVQEFFVQEYSLDYLIHACPKPILVISHGLTLGGGIGLLAGGTIRLVSSDSVLAMPEISIGYFTDVGASYFLNRMPGRAGLFCALTAARMTPSDAIYLGLADLCLESKSQESQMSENLSLESGGEESDSVSNFLKRLSQEELPTVLDRDQLFEVVKKWGARERSSLPPSLFEKYQVDIDEVCEGDTVLEVEQNLKKVGAHQKWELPWSLQPFREGSPTSAAVIFELLKRGRGRSLRECFDLELNLALEFCRRPEFVEGVRALLIDKDKKPRWNPTSLSAVDPREIDAYFTGQLRIEVRG
jgi:enoyl-CoA hydratase/carnithine racemase